MTLTEKFIQILLWLRIAISPTLIGAIIGLIICGYIGKLNIDIILFFVGLGFICGAFWAERVRKNPGLGMYFK
jgi:hypothetical protein